jgi:hypothetical protein
MGNCTPCGLLFLFNIEHVERAAMCPGMTWGDDLEFQLPLQLHLAGVEKLGHKEPSDLRHEQ